MRVEDGLEDVVPAYLAKRRADVARFRDALSAGDFTKIRNLAHKMKGTGTAYGFPYLTELAAKIEESAVECEASAAGDSIQKFESYVSRVVLEYIS